MLELLTPTEMAEADRLAIRDGPFDGYRLMRNAGAAVAAEILRRHPEGERFDVLCGPGNNGGDGYVVARLLADAGAEVGLWNLGEPKEGSAAALAMRECPVTARSLADFRPATDGIVVDALFGAGLTRPLEGAAARTAERCRASGAKVVSIDLPSGVSGASGQPGGAAFKADLSVTFFRRKPGHLLEPGREACGEIVVVDIGIPASVLETIRPTRFANHPDLWCAKLPRPERSQHKYSRGHAAVFSGGPSTTGAARLAAMAAARSGAGAVTLLSPGSAMAVNAAHLTAIMLKRVDDADARAFIAERKPSAFVLGPGFGVGEGLREMAMAILERAGGEAGLVLDADGITSFGDAPASLFIAAEAKGAAKLVVTPHEGEFARLFSGLARDDGLSKLDKARKAAARCHGVVVYKGPDTVVAAPDGRAAINENGTPWLATAGSGDVLSGMIAGLLAQKMPAFEAACAAVWMHAEAAARFGPGLIAEDLPGLLPEVLDDLL
jgi:hydroxyethylthiazole kinase-like uncharacterized protein yjeF